MGVITTSRRSRRVNLLPYFIGVILVMGVYIAFMAYRAGNTHMELEQDGVVTSAAVESVDLSRYVGTGRTGGHVERTSNPLEADNLKITVHFSVKGKDYSAILGTTFSLAHNDHVQVYNDASNGMLAVRYLESNPDVARPEAEFSDPNQNPYFGGR